MVDQPHYTFKTAAAVLGFKSDRSLKRHLCELYVLADHQTIARHYRNAGLFYHHHYKHTPAGHDSGINCKQLLISPAGMTFLHVLLNVPETNTTAPMGAPDHASHNARA